MADNIDDHIQVILANAKQTLTSDHNYQQFAIENFSVLQDIDWDIARLLASTWHQPVEDIALKLTEDVPADNLRLCRQQLCQHLKSQYAERENGNILHIKTRRSVTALAIIARDVAELFYYVSGIGNSLPNVPEWPPNVNLRWQTKQTNIKTMMRSHPMHPEKLHVSVCASSSNTL